MKKTFNIYCDESCHLENDHKPFMFLGYISCAYPQVKAHAEIPVETLFRHLTTEMSDKVTRTRMFEIDRSMRLHWVRYHLDQKKSDNMLLFSVREPEGIRTYYYDVDEKYVIVLEPLRCGDAYYLLSAYYIKGKDAQRNKMEKKYKRKLDVLH